MFFVVHKKIFFTIIGIVSVLSLGALFLWGLVFGIEFTGGTIVEVAYVGERPEKQILESELKTLDLGQFSLRQANEDGYILRTRDLSEEEYGEVRDVLASKGELIEKRRATVGPVIGEELKNKAMVAIGIVVILIVLFVAFAFRRIREEGEEDDDVENQAEVSSWTYGLVAIFVLMHDILVPLGMFAVLGRFFGAEVDVLIVMALLTILGYSVNDTIIIFDRVRENTRNKTSEEEPFEETVGKSLSQTYARSINTSLTTLMVVGALLFFGGPTTVYFALTLAVGVLAGTYSSIALAAPLLVVAKERKEKKLQTQQG